MPLHVMTFTPGVFTRTDIHPGGGAGAAALGGGVRTEKKPKMAARTLMMAAILLLSLFCCSDAVAKHKSAKSGLRMVKHRHAKTGSHSNAARKHKAKKAFAQLEAKMNSHSEVEVEGLGDFIHGAFSFVNEVGKDLKRKLLFYAVKYLTGANSVKEYHKNLDIVKAAVYDAEDEEILGANDLKDAAEQAQQVGADALQALKRILTAETETVFGKKAGKDRDPVENPSILRSLFSMSTHLILVVSIGCNSRFVRDKNYRGTILNFS